MEVATLILLVLCFRRAQESFGHAGLGRCAPSTASTYIVGFRTDGYSKDWCDG